MWQSAADLYAAFYLWQISLFKITENPTNVKPARKLDPVQSNKSMEPDEQTACCCPGARGPRFNIIVSQWLLRATFESKVKGRKKKRSLIRFLVSNTPHLCLSSFCHEKMCSAAVFYCTKQEQRLPSQRALRGVVCSVDANEQLWLLQSSRPDYNLALLTSLPFEICPGKERVERFGV